MLQVRPVQPHEHAAVGELTASTYLAEGWCDEDYAVLLRDVAARTQHATVLVAVDEDRLLGAVMVATAGGPYAEQTEPGTAVLRMLVTAPAARGRGVGTALVQACLTQARDAGCDIMRLSTQAAMTAAHRIYERLGFVRTPEHDWRPLPDLQLITYALALSARHQGVNEYCGQCGEPRDQAHPACDAKLELDPPRYCEQCRRRMVVQVHPTGWSARCVEHGTLTG